MAQRSWTDSQLDAINTRDRTLLVSAAAGSGKTATLTERLISSVLDENNPRKLYTETIEIPRITDTEI